MNVRIFIECADVVDFSCDVLVLKYAQRFYGADARVASLLKDAKDLRDISPRLGKYVLLPSKGKISASHVLFVGVVDLYEFDYEQIRKFATYSMQILKTQLPGASHIAMTMHGVGYGLDERESFLAQIAGLLDALNKGDAPPFLERITLVERYKDRAARLQEILEKDLSSSIVRDQRVLQTNTGSEIDAGLESNTKQHVFVAMPFSEDMEDVYIFGIQGPVNAAGYLCERVDMATFTGDILLRIKSRIETASLVIADLTGANANVYLEVGYAWGKDRPTLLLARKGDELKFDVKSQRCIIYKNIAELAKKLEIDLSALKQQA